MNVLRRLPLFAFITGLGTLGVPPAAAQIVVSSPLPACSQSLTAWYVHHIPLRFRAASRLAVRELSDANMDAYLHGDSDDMAQSPADTLGDIDGVYESHPDRIALRLPADRNSADRNSADHGVDMFTFAHEYGHYVWFSVFSDDDRRRYEVLYKHRRAAGHLVTRYAETGVEEGFAEAFSFYVAQPPILAARDPASFQFLAQWSLHSHTPS